MKKCILSVFIFFLLFSAAGRPVTAEESGEILIKDCGSFSNGLASFSYRGAYGYVNTEGEVVIDPQYDYAYAFDEETGLALVFNGELSDWGYPDAGEYGFIDSDGNTVIDMEYDDAYRFSEGLAGVRKDGKWGFIDAKGSVVIPLEWDDVSSFSEGIAQVKKGDLTGYIDAQGNTVSEPQWGKYSSSSCREGMIQVEDESGNEGYINTEGELVLPCEWDSAYNFSEGYALVRKDGVYGFIDKEGNYLVEPQWDDANSFSCGMASVEKDDKYGFIDASGELVVPAEWDKARDFVNDRGVVCRNGSWKIIDTSGNEIASLDDYDYVGYPTENGYVRSFIGTLSDYGSPDTGIYGYLDLEGREVIPCEYSDLSYMDEGGYVIGNADGTSYVLDLNGNRTAVKASPNMDTSKIPNFKSFFWGDSEDQIKASEGSDPDYTGDMSGQDAHYIGYDTKASGLDVILAYYFCDSGLYATRYILTEKHSVESKYIDDYNTFKSAITKKYGEPVYDNKSWDTDSHEEYYAGREGDALSYGYLTYYAKWSLDETTIYMDLSADNYDISLTIDYDSTEISPGAPDYSDDF